MSKDYYKILGVDKSASPDDIKRAFHKLAHQHHPDKAGGNEEKFKEANEAYQVLSNKDKRAQYDQFGQTFSGGGPGAGFNGAQGFNGQNFNFDMNDLGDMFGSFGDMFGFGGGRGAGAQGPARGEDLEVTVDLSFLEAAHGTTKTVKYRRQGACTVCQGNGAEPGTSVKKCDQCHGSGRVTQVQRTILGAIQMQTVCPGCRGQGQVMEKACHKCKGQGLEAELMEFEAKIPAGIDDGEAIKYGGRGSKGEKGGEAGSLYVRVRLQADKRWQRDGYNVLSQLDISYSEAVLGTKKEINTVEGEVNLKIPEGTISGKVFVLKGKGIVRLKSSGQGDHLVEVRLKVPQHINRNQKKLLEDLAKEGL
jgi:molecular chaperone DnaJ